MLHKCVLHDEKGLGLKYIVGWCCDKILVHFKKIGFDKPKLNFWKTKTWLNLGYTFAKQKPSQKHCLNKNLAKPWINIG